MFDPAARPNSKGIFPNVLKESNLFRGEVALGNYTQYRICLAWIGSWLFVGILERGAYEFDGYVHWGYAMEKLGLKNEADARNVADFINDQIHANDPPERQGTYDPSLCRD